MIFPGRSLPLQSRQFIESRGSRAGEVQDILMQQFHSVLTPLQIEEKTFRDSDWEHELRRRFLIATALN